MDTRGKIIAGSVLGAGLLFGLYEIGAHQQNQTLSPLPPQARTTTVTTTTSPALVPAANAPVSSTQPRYVSAAPGVGLIGVPSTHTTVITPVLTNGSATIPANDAGIRTPGVTTGTLVPAADGSSVSQTTTTTTATQKTAMAEPPHTTTYRRISVEHHAHYRHEKPGNVHLSRGVKHTVEFAAKLPFRLRP